MSASTTVVPAYFEAAPVLRRPALWAASTLVLALSCGLWVAWLDVDRHEQAQRAEALTLASAQSALLHQRLDAALSATYAMGAVLRQNRFEIQPEHFTQLATELLRYHPGLSSLQYLPDGVATHVFPREGHDMTLGYNLLRRPDRNHEALQAIASRQLSLAGPFELLQGGQGVAGRLPIFHPDVNGKPGAFWGFAVALLRLPDLLKSADLDHLTQRGYDYRLWRLHPQSGQPQVLEQTSAQPMVQPVVVDFPVANGRWFLDVAPQGGWLADHATHMNLNLGMALLLASLLAWTVYVLRRQPLRLQEQIARQTGELQAEIGVRRAAEASLKLAARVFESSAEAIMITDGSNKILSVNRSFSRMTGYDAAEVIGQTPHLLSSGRHDAAFFQTMFRTLMTQRHWQGEIWNRRKNGEIFPQWQGVSVVCGEDGQVAQYISISADITERKASQDRIHFLSHHDSLTGLPNRSLLQDRVRQAIQVADLCHHKVALLSIDLDRFKLVNDGLGHPLGDQLLIQVGERLKSLVCSSATLSRQGGDEFSIVLQEEAGQTVAADIAQRIQDQLAPHFVIGGHEIRISASIGIAVYPDDAGDLDTLFKRCDRAMYHAKESGRATHRFFTEDMHADTSERLSLEAELERAIERQEFVLHYQPQLDLQTERVIGAEALLRWQHPEKGLIPPGRFIPVAEESGLILRLGEWALGEACRQARAWQDAGLAPLVISVNLSGLEFHRPGLVVRIAAMLARHRLAPHCLELELTESILVQDVETVLQTVRELKALGLKLSIDDFGTGYSSLSYLKRFAVDKLKIDQSFVRELCSNPEDAAIVQAVIQLGQCLELEIIAEGVETAAQARHLRDQGCQQVQGYFFSRPLPAQDFEAFLLSGQGPQLVRQLRLQDEAAGLPGR